MNVTKDNKLVDLTLLGVFRNELLSEMKELLYPIVSKIEFNEETGDIEATVTDIPVISSTT